MSKGCGGGLLAKSGGGRPEECEFNRRGVDEAEPPDPRSAPMETLYCGELTIIVAFCGSLRSASLALPPRTKNSSLYRLSEICEHSNSRRDEPPLATSKRPELAAAAYAYLATDLGYEPLNSRGESHSPDQRTLRF